VVVVVDSGVLYAALNDRDPDHKRCLNLLESKAHDFVVPALVVTEVSFFLQERFTPAAEASFLRGLVDFEVEAPLIDEWEPIADLVKRYGNFPLGAVDASVVVLAERFETDLIATIDYRHFRSMRMRDGRPFHLLPE
jgi:predicted nucleic acid-binding protein